MHGLIRPIQAPDRPWRMCRYTLLQLEISFIISSHKAVKRPLQLAGEHFQHRSFIHTNCEPTGVPARQNSEHSRFLLLLSLILECWQHSLPPQLGRITDEECAAVCQRERCCEALAYDLDEVLGTYPTSFSHSMPWRLVLHSTFCCTV